MQESLNFHGRGKVFWECRAPMDFVRLCFLKKTNSESNTKVKHFVIVVTEDKLKGIVKRDKYEAPAKDEKMQV